MPNPNPPTKRKLKTSTSAYQGETPEPTVKPTPIPSDGEMDQVLAENPSPSYKMPSLSPTSSGGELVKGGTEAVAAYQRKLNSMGANLKVDGAWGSETQKAFNQFQGKSTPKAIVRKVSKEVVNGLPGGDIAKTRQGSSPASSPTKSTIPVTKKYTQSVDLTDALDKAYGYDTTDEVYEDGLGDYPEFTTRSGIKGRKLPDGRNIYPNGRISTPNGKGMMYSSKLPRRKLTPVPTGPRLTAL
ncbi:hypothetical protein Q5H92_14710 [Hymenobacter sp. M29]|uniref:Peptidoglycan binding-like domain-containing protein n=1 Tax=Hymenobacter mellowenesis TaxID=3063995 RepID=A0ABT9ACN6_9BACT|nr:hypothetical protein [Hymenobacter sp. M29]MDO7847617.1 hypothetical protein [Hymenobacter sp. M29]